MMGTQARVYHPDGREGDDMRDIKFRGKRKDIGWQYGYLTIIEKSHAPNVIAIKPLDEAWITYGVDPESVGQYTGLKDKNGTEIYEGDILFNKELYPDPFIMAWHIKGWKAKQIAAYDYWWDEPYQHYEVSSNIYENPELLEVKL